MSKKVWTQTPEEFIAKWAGRKLTLNDVTDAITDLLVIVQNLEKRL